MTPPARPPLTWTKYGRGYISTDQAWRLERNHLPRIGTWYVVYDAEGQYRGQGSLKEAKQHVETLR